MQCENIDHVHFSLTLRNFQQILSINNLWDISDEIVAGNADLIIGDVTINKERDKVSFI